MPLSTPQRHMVAAGGTRRLGQQDLCRLGTAGKAPQINQRRGQPRHFARPGPDRAQQACGKGMIQRFSRHRGRSIGGKHQMHARPGIGLLQHPRKQVSGIKNSL